jgi:hypothetical protein
VLNSRFYRIAACTLFLGLRIPATGHGLAPAEVLQSIDALPPHIVGGFGDPAAFEQAADGAWFVFDRRGHTVYRVAADRSSAAPIVAIGHELGRILRPFGFELGDGELAVADAPDASGARVQLFTLSGSRMAAFRLPGPSEARVQLDGVVLNGVGTLRFTPARTIVVNQPESGSLITEFDTRGQPLRTVGALRATAHDGDPQLRLAFNTGLPVPAPDGGFYFVFQTGEPRFRRYDAKGTMLYERAIQGMELDTLLQSQPTTWPRSTVRPGVEIPVVRPVVRAAALDRNGQLWVSFVVPYTFVYRDGEKVRTVQFRAAGLVTPTSLSFTADGRLLVTPGCYVFKP